MADPGTGAFINQLMNPPNPFATAGQSAQGLNALMQLRADRAAADAYQQSIDPQTGQFDPGKFQSLLAQGGPGATFHLGATMEQAGRGNQAQAAASSCSRTSISSARSPSICSLWRPRLQPGSR